MGPPLLLLASERTTLALAARTISAPRLASVFTVKQCHQWKDRSGDVIEGGWLHAPLAARSHRQAAPGSFVLKHSRFPELPITNVPGNCQRASMCSGHSRRENTRHENVVTREVNR